MALPDPLSVTVSGTPISLPRVSTGERKSEYQSGDGLYIAKFSHQETGGGRWRRMARIDTSKIAADVFKPSENVRVSMGFYLVWDLPPAGYTAADAKAVSDGFLATLAASSGAATLDILGGES